MTQSYECEKCFLSNYIKYFNNIFFIFFSSLNYDFFNTKMFGNERKKYLKICIFINLNLNYHSQLNINIQVLFIAIIILKC